MATLPNSFTPGVPLDIYVDIFQATGNVALDASIQLGNGTVIVSESSDFSSGKYVLEVADFKAVLETS